MKILAIEDDSVYVSLLKAHAARAAKGDFDMDAVPMLSQGLTKLSGQTYDCILLDLQLPDSRGSGTVITVRKEAGTIPIIVVTGSDNEQTAAEVIENGAQEYLVKGKVTVSGVFRAIKIAVERKNIDDRLREFKSAVNAAREPIVIMQGAIAEGAFGPRISYANPNFCMVTGYDAQDLIGRSLDHFAGEKTDKKSLQRIKDAFAKRAPLTLDVALYKRNRSPFMYRLTMTPELNSHGLFSHWILTGKELGEEANKQIDKMPQDGDRLLDRVRDLKEALAMTEQRLKLLQGGVRDHMGMIQSLSESNLQLLGKVQAIIRDEEE